MLCEITKCTGCQACANVCFKKCITMKNTHEGFLFPKISQTSCISCKRCEQVCPIIDTPKLSVHTISYAMKNKNLNEKTQSTSGGIFTLLAEHVLEKRGVVFGASYDSDFSVRHIGISDKEHLSLLQGAKYAQSKIGECFTEIKRKLKAGQSVLFSGTPCQCAGLKSFLGKEYDNLITVDIICHGIPSPKVWQAYIDYRSQKENHGVRPQKINMRSKVSGWSRYGYSTEFDYGNGNVTRIHNSQDLFMQVFIGNICLRNSCSNCKAKGVERCTDFTLGDYWGIWNQHPEFDDNKGTSVVFVHSQKGQAILEQLRDKIDCLEVNSKDAYRENMSLVNSSKPHPGRKEFLTQVTAENFDELARKYFPQKSIERQGILSRIKRKLDRMF